jgi:prepilin-type N-terminal cleavage/methylation domain-containing protein
VIRIPRPHKSQYGFTLIELLSTLVILSVLFSLAINRMVIADTAAKTVGLEAGISELNTRETLTWALVKMSNSGYLNDVPQVWGQLNTNIDGEYDWIAGPTFTGGTLRFKKDLAVNLIRSPSSFQTPGNWKR